jgi:uncharacterized protein
MLKSILGEFLTIDGVTTAALVGRDGFVIEIVSQQPVDIEALGALGSGLMQFFDRGGYSLEMGPLRQLAIEFGEGAIILTALTSDEFLAVITDSRAAVGRVSYALEKTSARVAAAI